MDVNDIIKVMNAQNEKASSLSLSKAGLKDGYRQNCGITLILSKEKAPSVKSNTRTL